MFLSPSWQNSFNVKQKIASKVFQSQICFSMTHNVFNILRIYCTHLLHHLLLPYAFYSELRKLEVLSSRRKIRNNKNCPRSCCSGSEHWISVHVEKTGGNFFVNLDLRNRNFPWNLKFQGRLRNRKEYFKVRLYFVL